MHHSTLTTCTTAWLDLSNILIGVTRKTRKMPNNQLQLHSTMYSSRTLPCYDSPREQLRRVPSMYASWLRSQDMPLPWGLGSQEQASPL